MATEQKILEGGQKQETKPEATAPNEPTASVIPSAPSSTAHPVDAPLPAPAREPAQPGLRRARGTAAMTPETRHEVARKGGLAVSRNRSHMAEIGRKGGQKVSRNREHMAEIGRKGGEASRKTGRSGG